MNARCQRDGIACRKKQFGHVSKIVSRFFFFFFFGGRVRTASSDSRSRHADSERSPAVIARNGRDLPTTVLRHVDEGTRGRRARIHVPTDVARVLPRRSRPRGRRRPGARSRDGERRFLGRHAGTESTTTSPTIWGSSSGANHPPRWKPLHPSLTRHRLLRQPAAFQRLSTELLLRGGAEQASAPNTR